MTTQDFSPSARAFFAEHDQIRAHRDRLAADVQHHREVNDKLAEQVRQEVFKIERLEREIDNITAQRDVHSRVVYRLVAKVETMALVMAAQVNEIKDEIERAQFAPPKPEPGSDEEFLDGEQWTEAKIVAMRERLDRVQPPIGQVISSIDDIGDDEEISAEEIGRNFGAGFPTPEELLDTSSQIEFVPKPVKRSEPVRDWSNEDVYRDDPSVIQTPSRDRLPPPPSFRDPVRR